MQPGAPSPHGRRSQKDRLCGEVGLPCLRARLPSLEYFFSTNFQVVSVDRSILEVRTQFPGILSLGCGPVGVGPANQIHQWETLL